VSEAEAAGDPRIHQITRWLGEDAPAGAPAVSAFVPARPGRLVLCSDGLWNYASQVDEFGALVQAQGAEAAPVAVARALVDCALSRGGHDNITVAVIDVTADREGHSS
jgi:serine/threonine protein phosphatase PrpC